MFLQDNDPHHLHPDSNSIYYFIIAAVIVTGLAIFVGVKVMTFLDSRRDRADEKKSPKKTDEKHEKF